MSLNSGTNILSGTPTNDDVGIHDIELVIADSNNVSTSQTYRLTVLNVNDLLYLQVHPLLVYLKMNYIIIQ